jgi:Phosphotransferase enzyme family
MNQRVPTDSVRWRLVLLRSDAPEVLLFQSSSVLRLPVVAIPIQSRTALNINAQVKALWGIDVVSLYSLDTNEIDSGARYHVVEAIHRDAQAPSSACWIPLSTITRNCFEQAGDFTAVETGLGRKATRISGGQRQPFEAPGWFVAVKEMVRKSAEKWSLVPTGQFVQFNASRSFSLVRFETDGRALWFKAVGEPNVREFELTALLSSRLSEFVPRVLTTEPAWNAWTVLGAGGVPLSRANDTAAWCRAARDLARMQIASIVVTDELLACHARDVRVQALLGQLKPFFQVMNELMDRQPVGTPRALAAGELRELEIGIREALLDLLGESAPDTVGHLDLNPDNIMVDSGGAVFLDWAEGAVGHPFLSLSYLLEFSSRRFEADIEATALLIRSYAREWEAAGLALDFGPTLTTCTLLAIFAHAVSTDLWRDDQHLQDPGVAGYYRSLTRRMKKYSDRIRNGIYDITGVLG